MVSTNCTEPARSISSPSAREERVRAKSKYSLFFMASVTARENTELSPESTAVGRWRGSELMA